MAIVFKKKKKYFYSNIVRVIRNKIDEKYKFKKLKFNGTTAFFLSLPVYQTTST